MTFNLKGLLILVGFGALLTIAMSSNGGAWFHIAEAAATVVILLGVAGLLGAPGPRTPRRSI